MLLAVWICGCFNENAVRLDPAIESWFGIYPPNPNPFVGVDILVVVDNSDSIALEQELLVEAFPTLLEELLDPPMDPMTGRPVHPPVRDVHVGVVSTDMGVGGYVLTACDDAVAGDDGILQHAPRAEECDAAYPDFLYYQRESHVQADRADIEKLARDFGCIAALGKQGCGYEQQLEAAWKALVIHSQPGGANAGFLRQDTILVIIFVTDEDDCSASDLSIFDIASLPYNSNLQCFYQKNKLRKIGRYAEDLKSLRSNSDDLVVGFIVGVPQGEPACEGRGDEIGGCLDVPAMQEVVRSDGMLLEHVCKYPSGCTPSNPQETGSCMSDAYPARRLVQLAQEFGENAVVSSICAKSYVPVMAALGSRIGQTLGAGSYRNSRLPVVKDPTDPEGCRCFAACDLIEELSSDRPCPAVKAPYDGDGDTIGDMNEDPVTGAVFTLCKIPQAGSIMESCAMACNDPESRHVKNPEAEGWWYNPTYDPDGNGEHVSMVITLGVEPEEGSFVHVKCPNVICPTGRSCGSRFSPGAKCCAKDQYCYYPDLNMDTSGYCLVREDICREFGDDAWCPGAGPVGDDPLIGGLCCLDPDADGDLDMIDLDGDGLEDMPMHRCRDGQCMPI